MSDLLGIGLSGVVAYRTALAAVADNVANAENPGYARREVRLKEGVTSGAETPIYREDLLFGGVAAASVGRAWDAFRAADSRLASAAAGRARSAPSRRAARSPPWGRCASRRGSRRRCRG